MLYLIYNDENGVRIAREDGRIDQHVGKQPDFPSARVYADINELYYQEFECCQNGFQKVANPFLLRPAKVVQP